MKPSTGPSISINLHHALLFKMAQNLDLRCGFGPSALGAGAKTRFESRIKKFTAHCVCRPSQLWEIDGQMIRSRNTRPQFLGSDGLTHEIPPGTCPTLQTSTCAYANNKARQLMAQCEVDQSVSPFMCLSARDTASGTAGAVAAMAALAPCNNATGDGSNGLTWRLHEVLASQSRMMRQRSSFVYGGAYTRQQYVMRGTNAGAGRHKLGWYQRLLCNAEECKHCVVGSIGNTCQYACDGTTYLSRQVAMPCYLLRRTRFFTELCIVSSAPGTTSCFFCFFFCVLKFIYLYEYILL